MGRAAPQYPVRENMPRRTHVMAPAWTPRLRRRDSPGEVATRQRRRRSATSRCLSAAWAWLACRAAVCVIGPGWGRCEPAALEGFSGMVAPWFVSHASGETDGGFVRARAAGAAGAPILPESARAAAMPAANGSPKGVDAWSSVPSGRIEDSSGAGRRYRTHERSDFGQAVLQNPSWQKPVCPKTLHSADEDPRM